MKSLEVLSTRDYGIFKFAEYNRNILNSTVEKLKKEYHKENNFMYFPIVVDEDYTIIDGQHRFITCKELNEPIYYIKKHSKINISQIRTVNKAGRKHSITDIFEMECSIGNTEALKIKSLISRYSGLVDVGVALPLCLGASTGGSLREIIEKGGYKTVNMDNCYLLCDLLIKITRGGRVSPTIYTSAASIASYNGISLLTLVSEVNKRGLHLTSGMSKTVIMNNIIQAYNHRRQSQNKIKIK